MKSKKILAAVLGGALLLGMSACDLRQVPPSSVAAPSSVPAAVSVPEPPPAPAPYPFPETTAINPLTGLPRAEGLEPGQRPAAVMVDNSQKGMPQRGLAAADVLYEMVTEGGSTGLMPVYSDYRMLPQVGPVRSATDVFVQFAVPGNYILSHIKTTVYAGNLLKVLSYKTVDGIYLGSSAFWFDESRAVPHEGGKSWQYCWFTDAGLLWAGMEMLDVYTTGEVPALFVFTDAPVSAAAEAYWVSAAYSDTTKVEFSYDEVYGVYLKYAFGQPHMDQDGSWLNFTNLVLLEAPLSIKADGVSAEYTLTSGTGYYFTGGKMQQISWKKGAPESRLELYDEAGAPLLVQRGKSYIGLVPLGQGPGTAVAFAPKPAEPPVAPESVAQEPVQEPVQEPLPPQSTEPVPE